MVIIFELMLGWSKKLIICHLKINLWVGFPVPIECCWLIINGFASLNSNNEKLWNSCGIEYE